MLVHARGHGAFSHGLRRGHSAALLLQQRGGGVGGIDSLVLCLLGQGHRLAVGQARRMR